MNHIKKIVTAALFMSLALGVHNASADASFKDVSSTHWANNAIQSAVSKGYFKGYADGTFKPNAPVTKEEFAVLLSRVSSNEFKEGTISPSSVLGRWSEEGVTEAIAKGFVSSNEIVDPQEKISRIQMVRWMVTGLSETSSSYAEAAEATRDTVVPVAEYYKGGLNKKDYGDVSVALGTGLMTGFTNGSFGPDQTTTRAEVASILLRLEKIQEKKATDYSQLLELVEVGLTGSNAITLGIKYGGSEKKPLDVASIRGVKHNLKNNKGTLSIDRVIVVDPDKKESLYHKMFMGNNFPAKIKDGYYALFTLVNMSPNVTVTNWGDQLNWNPHFLTASGPFQTDSLKNYGYPYLPRDLENYLVKGKTYTYWSIYSLGKRGDLMQVPVGSKNLTMMTE